RLSNTMDAEFCIEALRDALMRYGTPEIFNTDQGSQGRFNRSSQHPILGGDDDNRKTQIRALDAAQIILA
ncbi:hypothetical protein, partial [Gluconobacter kondonii]|uniref:hypothetical protein n=1 Tax=Gluconobacter kondonii TaxID=941463 RepID=UPI0024E0C159